MYIYTFNHTYFSYILNGLGKNIKNIISVSNLADFKFQIFRFFNLYIQSTFLYIEFLYTHNTSTHINK